MIKPATNKRNQRTFDTWRSVLANWLRPPIDVNPMYQLCTSLATEVNPVEGALIFLTAEALAVEAFEAENDFVEAMKSVNMFCLSSSPIRVD